MIENSSKDSLTSIIQLLAVDGRQSTKMYTRLKALCDFDKKENPLKTAGK